MWWVALTVLAVTLHVSDAITGSQSSQATEGDFPSIVAWIDSSGEYFCSGSLITNQHVLTAASCFLDPVGYAKYKNRNGRALIGTSLLTTIGEGVEILDIAHISVHPAWNPLNWQHHKSDLVDLAVIRLTKHVENYGEMHTTKSMVLISAWTSTLASINTQASLAGWGAKTGSGQANPTYRQTRLQSLGMTIADPEKCEGDAEYFMSTGTREERTADYDRHASVCAMVTGNNSPCLYDEGAPFIVASQADREKYQVGVYAGLGPDYIDSIHQMRSTDPAGYIWDLCGATNYPLGVDFDGRPSFARFTSMLRFGTWIQEHTNTILPHTYTEDISDFSPSDNGIRLVTPDPNPICAANVCGKESPSGLCWCDLSCEAHGDCCTNFNTVCAALASKLTSPQGSCAAGQVLSAGKMSPCGHKVLDCWCDQACIVNEDCCSDYSKACGILGGGENSCLNKCGTKSGDCWCDSKCKQNQDCCLDYQLCQVPGTIEGSGSCLDNCGGSAGICWCDLGCLENGDCCPNFEQQCGNLGSCSGHCGHHSGSCWCDMQCMKEGDCCEDYSTYCNFPDYDVFVATDYGV